jgi:hypothetical protein
MLTIPSRLSQVAILRVMHLYRQCRPKVNTHCKISFCEGSLISWRLMSSLDTPPTKLGLRERKKQQTRE